MPRKRQSKNKRTDLQPFLINKVYRNCAKGIPMDAIIDLLGIDQHKFWEWKKKGDVFLRSGGPEEHEIFGDLVKAIRKGLAEYRVDLVDQLHDATNADWKRQLAILERRDKESFSRQIVPGSGADENFDPDERFL